MVIHIQSDILIIGAGVAGFRAAIQVHEEKVKVVLVSKSSVGYNNSTILSRSCYLAAFDEISKDVHRELTLIVGRGLNNPALVEILVREGRERVLELSNFGCDLNVRHGCINVEGLDSVLCQGITLPMVKYIRNLGIEFIENTIITKLLKNDGMMIGAVGYSSQEEQPILFQAKAVILASGGSSGLFKRAEFPLRSTGDGYSLAFRAGAKLRDMEFCQFIPLALAEPNAPHFIIDDKLMWEGKILNSLGEDIPTKYNIIEQPYIIKKNILLSRAVMQEVHDGAGIEGTVLLDAREVLKKINLSDRCGINSYKYYVERLRANERPIRIAPISHYTNGGVVANSYGETDISGLLVAGEVMGGVHGATKYNGNSITDEIVFGVRVANKAVEYIQKKDFIEVEELAKSEFERYEKLVSRDIGFTPSTLMDIVRKNMWENVGVIRSSYMLVEAYQKLTEIRDSTRHLLAKHGIQLLNALELIMALDVCEFIVRAAMDRRESRGTHFRIDHPDEDASWIKTIILSKKSDAILINYASIAEVFS